MAEQVFLHAVSSGDARLVSTIAVETNVNINASTPRGANACHICVEKGFLSILELVLSYGCDPNVQLEPDVGNLTPLHMAVGKGNKKFVETLLNHYADPNLQDRQGLTPLHLAAQKGMSTISKLLISRGCCVTTLDAQGKTAAYWAKEYDHKEILDLLQEGESYDYLSKVAKEKKEGNRNITLIEKAPPPKKGPTRARAKK